ncbi:MAG: DUF805 domain-containing protein [Proteobacteria bacterium]|nr:DUF805 domain-containing protein [Pseudomonadota bacterium]
MKFDKSLFSFDGRARRSQFWLTRILIGVALVVVIGILGAIGRAVDPTAGQPGATNLSPVSMIIGLVSVALIVVAIWMDLAVTVKRCHDRDKSGWFILIAFIPIIGGIWLLIELGFLDGAPRPNKYGPSPKYPDPAAQAFA